MDHFNYRQGELYAEDVPVRQIVEQYGSPCYIYSRATLERHWRAFDSALGEYPHLICYAVKANSNLGVLDVLARLGSGFDIVSVGELERVLQAGGKANNIVFSGAGKREDEIRRALEAGIYCFNIESAQELQRIAEVAERLGQTAPISIRVNPDVDARTHPYISTGLKENKFGIPFDEAESVYRRASALASLEIKGIDCHIGSQLTSVQPFVDALQRLLQLVDRLEEQGIHLTHLDIGGGLGIRYDQEQPPAPQEYAEAIKTALAGRDLRLLIEPGRAIAANAGILVTRVEYLKTNDDKRFALVDAAMNDLMRPALYDAWQAIIPVAERQGTAYPYDVVGPVCETGDFLGKDRPLVIEPGDLLAVRSAGAYGFTMSSNYNTRPRVPELMVDGERIHQVRRREPLESLWALESCLPG